MSNTNHYNLRISAGPAKISDFGTQEIPKISDIGTHEDKSLSEPFFQNLPTPDPVLSLIAEIGRRSTVDNASGSASSMLIVVNTDYCIIFLKHVESTKIGLRTDGRADT